MGKKIISSEKGKWIFFGVILVVFAGVFLYCKSGIDAFGLNDRFRGMFLLFSGILPVLLAVSFLLLFFKIRQKSIGLEYVFLIVFFSLGIMYNTLIPAMAAPDEDNHMPFARAVAGDLSGHHSDENGLMFIPEGEADPGLESRDINREYYDRYLEWLFEENKADDTNWEMSWYWENQKYYRIIYFPGGAGIALGRLLGCNYVFSLYLGRLFNLLFFSLAGFYAIKKTPIGKELIFLLSMLPITIQQAASFSADGVVIALSLMLLAGTLSLCRAEKINAVFWVDLAVLTFAAVLLGKAKFGACFPICLLLLLIPIKQWRKNRRIAVLGLAVLAASFVFGFLPGIHTMLTDARVLAPALGGNPTYTFQDIKDDPLQIFFVALNTVAKNVDEPWIIMMGASLGWFTIQIPVAFILAFLPLFWFALLQDESNPFMAELDKKTRFLLFFIGFIGIGMTCGGLLVDWTPAGSKTIAGIQGRYFLPYLPMILFSLIPKRIRYANGMTARRITVMLGILLEALIVEALIYRARVIVI